MTDSAVDRQQEVQRILDSETFRNKPSLRRLLLYLWERTSKGTAESLKEYTVGLEVLGKPETYDPQIDPSARVLIGKLRQKLKEYYASEGANDPFVVELPRRHFGLLFHASGTEPIAESPQLDVQVDEAAPIQLPMPRLAFGLLCFGAGALIAFAAAWLLRNQAPASSSTVRTFWQPILDSPRPTVVCFGTPLFLRFYGARLRLPVDDFEEAKQSPLVQSLRSVFPEAEPQPSYIFTGVGEAAGGFLLSKLFTQWQKDVSWRRNSALTWDDIRTSNVVFLGSARYNPHVRSLPLEQSFLVDGGGVTNLHPEGGEPAKFYRAYSSDEHRKIVEDYAVVSRLPGLNGQGEIVVLGSSSTEGTLAAVEYATQARHLDGLFAHLRKKGPMPKYFEAVIRVRFRDMAPVESSWVTHRVVQAAQR